MTTGSTTVTPLATYRNETPFPFCPGCGHGPILDHLNRALVELQLDPRRVVIVSDIGCSGLSDQYFTTSAFHGLHGRSITYASGIKLARPELKVIVVMGDGGTGIGGTHLINAARRNIGMTVLIFNNFNFGMTGGQHSTTTPPGAITSTTPSGSLERPLDICATAAVNGAAFVYRGTSFDSDLGDHIAEAIGTEGFSVLDIWELCTAYFVPKNRMSKKALFELLEKLELATGVLERRDIPEYALAYREVAAKDGGQPAFAPLLLQPQFESSLADRFRVVVAGSAGGKVGSAMRLMAQGATLSGLWAVQRSDYPVTVQTGHSVSELVLDREEIHYAGVSRPDALAILTEDGRRKSARYLAQMTPDDQVFGPPEFADVATQARFIELDLAKSPSRVSKTGVALATVAAMTKRLGLFPITALEEAVRGGPPEHREGSLKAIAAGIELV